MKLGQFKHFDPRTGFADQKRFRELMAAHPILLNYIAEAAAGLFNTSRQEYLSGDRVRLDETFLLDYAKHLDTDPSWQTLQDEVLARFERAFAYWKKVENRKKFKQWFIQGGAAFKDDPLDLKPLDHAPKFAVLQFHAIDGLAGALKSNDASAASFHTWQFCCATYFWMRGHGEYSALTTSKRQAAIARHRKDPKQAEKGFVKECWVDWQKEPSQYRGKAAFSRAMLDKCEHLTSTAKIQEWCLEWERAATQPSPC